MWTQWEKGLLVEHGVLKLWGTIWEVSIPLEDKCKPHSSIKTVLASAYHSLLMVMKNGKPNTGCLFSNYSK